MTITRSERFENRKKQILEYLKKNGRKPTSNISVSIGSPMEHTSKVLDSLLNENKVVKEVETNATYWSLK